MATQGKGDQGNNDFIKIKENSKPQFKRIKVMLLVLGLQNYSHILCVFFKGTLHTIQT